MSGIFLDSNFLNFSFWKEAKMVKLFIYLLLNSDQNGEVKTTLNRLAEAAGMSKQEIRTALKKLEATQLATQRATQRATQINICNITSYKELQHNQQHNLQHNQQHTGEKTGQNSDTATQSATHLLINNSDNYKELQHNQQHTAGENPFIYNINNNICNNNKKGNFENFEEGEILTLNTEEEKEKNCAKKEKEMIDARHPAPTLEEINDYIEKKGFTNVIGVQFFSHYKATGWKTTGGAKILNWRAKVDSWEYSDIKKQANGQNNATTEPRRDVKPEEF